MPRLDSFIELEGNQSVVDATLENRALVSRTELEDEASGVRAVLEYPVKTMNVLRSPVRFQIDTGPIIVPDFASEAELAVARLDLAHVVYNLFDRGELILRKPVAVGGGRRRDRRDGLLGEGRVHGQEHGAGVDLGKATPSRGCGRGEGGFQTRPYAGGWRMQGEGGGRGDWT